MNDFTKEELQLIKSLITTQPEVGTHIEGLGKLMVKLQSLTENYCDHKDGETIYTRTAICSKCENPK